MGTLPPGRAAMVPAPPHSAATFVVSHGLGRQIFAVGTGRGYAGKTLCRVKGGCESTLQRGDNLAVPLVPLPRGAASFKRTALTNEPRLQMIEHAHGKITSRGDMLADGVDVWIEKVLHGKLYDWHGGLTLRQGHFIGVGGPYRLELDDGRSGEILVTKMRFLGTEAAFQGSSALK